MSVFYLIATRIVRNVLIEIFVIAENLFIYQLLMHVSWSLYFQYEFLYFNSGMGPVKSKGAVAYLEFHKGGQNFAGS